MDKDQFPDSKDLEIQTTTEKLVDFADKIYDWVGKFSGSRSGDHELKDSELFELFQLRRLAKSLDNASRRPVAACLYGASQTGKSLFVGKVLKPKEIERSPLGFNDEGGPPTYISDLRFDEHINPRSANNEATCLATRLTTKDRFGDGKEIGLPIKIRALSRQELLKVLARGFESECPPSNKTWDEKILRDLFEETSVKHDSVALDRQWQLDLLETFQFMKSRLPQNYPATEALFNSILSRYPLTQEGYFEIAGKIFWDSTEHPEVRTRIDKFFQEVLRFIEKIISSEKDSILVQWEAAKFLLDSQRADSQEFIFSGQQKKISWKDFRFSQKRGWYVIEHSENGTGSVEELWKIQASMLEMVIPVIPSRLNADWKDVLHKMDILDLPGMVSGGGESAKGRSNTVEKASEFMEIVKRGKVFYLIERYIEERELQTILILMRGGNLHVRSLLKEYVDKWGRIRYGENVWPRKVDTQSPALFIGMTGIDDEFKEFPPVVNLYDIRLENIVERTFNEVMKHFGGDNRRFTNIFPIRYPGVWDKDDAGRQKLEGMEERTKEAEHIFINSKIVQEYVKEPKVRWDKAMDDRDGGLSLISRGFLDCTNQNQRQESLERKIHEVRQKLEYLTQRWKIETDRNIAIEKRKGLANQVMDWLLDGDSEQHSVKTRLLESSLAISEEEAIRLAECLDRRADSSRIESKETRLKRELDDFLTDWSTNIAPRKWQAILSGEWQKFIDKESFTFALLSVEQFGSLARYLNEYFRKNEVFEVLYTRFKKVIIDIKVDPGSRLHVLREYCQLIFNDFIMNPGPSMHPLNEEVDIEKGKFGLMESFFRRWKQRLPEALASGAGDKIVIPSGNEELIKLLNSK